MNSEERLEDIALQMPDALHDDTPLPLNPDQTQVCKRAIKDLGTAMSYLDDAISRNDVTISTRFSALSLMSTHVRTLKEQMGYEDDARSDLELTSRKLRLANQEIRRLEAQIGRQHPMEGIGERLHLLYKEIDEWWKGLGFSYLDGHFESKWGGKGSFSGKFSLHLARFDLDRFDEQPATKQLSLDAKIEEMTAEGVEILRSRDEKYLFDTDFNKAWLVRKFRERFPHVWIINWTSQAFPQQKKEVEPRFQLREVEVSISFEDIIR
jgi:hypothetical protein